MKLIYLIILCFLFTQNLKAQPTKQTIKGIVKDAQNMLVAGAIIELASAGDTTLIQRKLSNNKGVFEFTNLAKGTYILTIKSIGNLSYKSGLIAADSSHENIVLPVIFLTPTTANNLKNVTVTIKRPLLEQDIDKTIVNVDAMISSATSNTLEVLEKTPGISISNNGEITLNGKSGVLVLIDGRATYMSAQDLAIYLKSLPGAMLDKIELMDNPPAKYDAAGSAIINIRLKKNKTSGFTGNVSTSYSQGKFARTNDATNLNYHTKKINLFANLGYTREKNYNNDLFDRKFYSENETLTSSVDLKNLQNYSFNSTSLRFGADINATPKTSFGFIVNANVTPRHGTLDYVSNSLDASKLLDSVGKGNTLGRDTRKNGEINLNYNHKFNDAGHELSADVNYLNYKAHGKQDLLTYTYLPDNTITNTNAFYYDLPSAINIYSLKADYVHPIKKKASLEAGIKSSFVTNNNDSKYFNVAGSLHTQDYTQSNHFIYHENINAAYINARKSWTRVGLQLGLRAENTRLNGKQTGNDSIAGSYFEKSYTEIFPTAFVSYKLDSMGNNTLTASFSRRINRPNYQLLNPFLAFRDNYTYNTGNPLLLPQYQNRAEIKYQYKKYFGLNATYGQFKDVIFSTTEAVGDIFINKPANIASGYMLVLASNVSLTPVKFWSINVNAFLAHAALKGVLYEEKFNNPLSMFRVNIMNQLSFNKGWSAEVTAFYSGKDLQGQIVAEPRYRVFTAAQKKIFKDKGSIKISIEDVFHSWIQKDNSVSIKQATAYHYNESDTQRIGLAFTYRFGKDAFTRKSKHAENAAEQEKGRVE